MMRLEAKFFAQPADVAAPRLIGKLLCRRLGRKVVRLRITETEAYCGEADTACHAHRGRTARTAILYEPGGRAYVYHFSKAPADNPRLCQRFRFPRFRGAGNP
jgi:DNA-3-methyladenine glycosylase